MHPKTDFLVALSASISNKIKFSWQYSSKFFWVRRFRVRSVHWRQTNIFFKASLIFILKQIIIENTSHHQLSSTIEPLSPSAHIICNDYCNNPKLIKKIDILKIRYIYHTRPVQWIITFAWNVILLVIAYKFESINCLDKKYIQLI